MDERSCGMNEVQRPILLVEDNEDDQILTAAAFQTAGIDCALHPVPNAEEAIQYLTNTGAYKDSNRFPRPAVILVDLTLPGKSGHDLLKWMGQRKEFQTIVRVVLSGSDNPEDVDTSYALGAHGYLLKPLTPDQLMQPGPTLKMLLRRSHPRAVAQV